jgi:hypothetical protein
MKAEYKQLNHLTAVLYETVLDPSRRKEAIGLCGQYAGGIDAQLLTMCKKTDAAVSAILAETFFPDQGNADYVNYYCALDPRIKYLGSGILNEYRCCHEVT